MENLRGEMEQVCHETFDLRSISDHNSSCTNLVRLQKISRCNKSSFQGIKYYACRYT